MLSIGIHTLNKIQKKSLFLFLCLFTTSMISLAQNKDINQKITISLHEISLENALDSIAKKTNTYFTYDTSILLNKPLVNLVANEEILYDILRKIVPDTTLDFQLMNKQIIIVPAKREDNFAKNIISLNCNLKR